MRNDESKTKYSKVKIGFKTDNINVKEIISSLTQQPRYVIPPPFDSKKVIKRLKKLGDSSI